MIILLTGEPGVGKSTLIEKLVKQYAEPASWVVTAGIPRPEGGRAGFSALNSEGVTRTISHKTDIDSDVIIGENHVDLEAVEAMFATALENALTNNDTLTIVDEIGPIQLLSPAFTNTLHRVFAEGADLVATIHYSDERLRKYRESPGVLLIQVSKESRDELVDILLLILKHRHEIDALPEDTRTRTLELLRTYIAHSQTMQLQKLLNHAIRYVAEKRLQPLKDNEWTITGDHGSYTITKEGAAFACTCDLFNGRSEYTGRAGECSHIQAVRLASGN